MSIDSLPVPRTTSVVFTAPPPGLSPLVDFELAPVNGAIGLFTLHDTHGADVRLFLVDPSFFVPDYVPEIRAEHWTALGADAADPLELYVVATIDGGSPVVNLLAPILVNPETHAARQVILDEEWPLRAELIAPVA